MRTLSRTQILDACDWADAIDEAEDLAAARAEEEAKRTAPR